jgi:N6-L-threonylcarbamoyladenine synthase
MVVLGIESSCDETAAAVIEAGWELRSNVIASQVDLHAPFGGVVPEIASRRHVELITSVIQEALDRAEVSLDAIEGVAVTNRPGLIGSLMVGVTAAKTLAFARSLPLVGVHHLEGHIFSSFVTAGGPHFPAVALIASGGHTELFEVRGLHDYVHMGRRRDDAAGEAFDKGARALGLGNGGGAALDRLARSGDPAAVSFPRPRTALPLDFSFSGLKTSLVRLVQERGSEYSQADLAASYQAAIVDALVDRSMEALRITRSPYLIVGGGVAANSLLQERLRVEAGRAGVTVLFPDRILCTDNAGMIAAVGHSLLDRGVRHGLDLETLARSPLTSRNN